MRILILDHSSEFLPDIIDYFDSKGIQTDLKKPMNVNPSNNFDGIVASGGVLPRKNYRDILNWYKDFLNKLDKPFLGICLGLKIIGHCHGARIKKILMTEGIFKIIFNKDFQLAPNYREMEVYQSHEFELIQPLPRTLENYATDNDNSAQAIRVRGRQQFGVQFHPEKKNTDGHVILDNFVKICEDYERGR